MTKFEKIIKIIFMKYSTEQKKEKAFLIGVTFKNNISYEEDLKELSRLAETAGLVVVGQSGQYIREITPATLLGSGKLEEIKEEINSLNVDVVIVDYDLSGSQCMNISNLFNVKVIDRMALILDIFAQRATSNEGMLQVELAQLKYSLPRLNAIQGTSGRFGSAGVGMRGPGETKLEMDKRVIRVKIQKLEKEILKIKQQRDLKRQKRNTSGKKKVAIVGYTNSGKSTLLNTISKAGIYADDKLFATLETTSRNIWLGDNKQIILTDTVGFINKLPHMLVDAFASTLEEALDADLILHVVDISNPDYKKQINVVNSTLKEIGADDIPQIIAYNKCDKIHEALQLSENEIFISAKTGKNIEELKELIKQKV